MDVISVDVYPEEYRATDYAKEYEELVRNTSDKKNVCKQLYHTGEGIN